MPCDAPIGPKPNCTAKTDRVAEVLHAVNESRERLLTIHSGLKELTHIEEEIRSGGSLASRQLQHVAKLLDVEPSLVINVVLAGINVYREHHSKNLRDVEDRLITFLAADQ